MARQQAMARTQMKSAGDEFPNELPKQHEVVRGILVRKAMPGFRHSVLQRRLSARLDAFDGKQRTPGGWWLATECEIELFAGERYLPDLAGWKIDAIRERPVAARVRIPPHWVCEILSPSTADRDLGDKHETYYRAHIPHYWIVDLNAPALTVLRWTEGGYRSIATAGPGECTGLEPFQAVELDIDQLFELDRW